MISSPSNDFSIHRKIFSARFRFWYLLAELYMWRWRMDVDWESLTKKSFWETFRQFSFDPFFLGRQQLGLSRFWRRQTVSSANPESAILDRTESFAVQKQKGKLKEGNRKNTLLRAYASFFFRAWRGEEKLSPISVDQISIQTANSENSLNSRE